MTAREKVNLNMIFFFAAPVGSSTLAVTVTGGSDTKSQTVREHELDFKVTVTRPATGSHSHGARRTAAAAAPAGQAAAAVNPAAAGPGLAA